MTDPEKPKEEPKVEDLETEKDPAGGKRHPKYPKDKSKD
jgi:hypothetical protein